MTVFVRLLALSLIFFSLSACGIKKMPEYQYNYNPDPKKRYEITMTINGAPGEFKNIEGVAQYEVSNDSCVPLTNPMSGVKHTPRQNINFNYSRISDTEFRGVFYADLLKDEDYFGMGVCTWSLKAIRFHLEGVATIFSPDMMADDFSDGAEKTTYYVAHEFFDTAMPGRIISGESDPSRYKDEFQDQVFSLTLRVKEDF